MAPGMGRCLLWKDLKHGPGVMIARSAPLIGPDRRGRGSGSKGRGEK